MSSAWMHCRMEPHRAACCQMAMPCRLYSMHVRLSCLCSMPTDNVWFFQFKPPSGQHSLPEPPSDFQASMANQDVFLILSLM